MKLRKSAVTFIAKNMDVLIGSQEWNDKLLSSAPTSGFTIICNDGKSIPCHKFMLAKHSEVLEEELKPEASTLTMDDFDSVTVESMLHFIYTGKLPDGIRVSPR
jgi:hypothetical protein